MKTKNVILIVALGVLSTGVVSAQETKAESTAKKEIKAEAVTYYCPMKCEGDKVYKEAGSCPKCGMALVKLEKKVVAKEYYCPMKCEKEKTYTKEGSCPVCSMDLVELKAKKAVKTGHEGHNH